MLFIVIYILILLCALHLITKGVKSQTNYLRNIPSPPVVLGCGNMLEFIGGSRVFLDKLLEYLKKYGDAIILHDGAFSWAVINIDYEFNEMLFNSSVHLEKSKQYKFLDGWLGQGLLTGSGSHWRSHRKVITPSFHFSILQEFVKVFDSVGDNLIRKLRNEVGKNSVEISKTISLCTLDIICEAAMGVKINSLEAETSEYIRSIKTMCSIIVDRSFSPLSTFLYPLTWNYYKEKKALRVIHKVVENIIDQRIKDNQNIGHNEREMEELGRKKHLAFLDLLLDAKVDGKPFTRRELRDEVNTFMFEGHDTTASAITFCLLMLATHPDSQEKAIQEQIDLFGAAVKSVHPTYKQLNDMKYLDLVIKETLRLYPSVPFFGRTLAEDIDFKGTLYPKGLPIMIFPYAFHRKAEYFADPEKFMPERFDKNTSKLPFTYTPFSAGPRNCIGQKFAMLEMLSTLSKILRHFKLAPATPEHKIQLAAETILISKNGVKISLQERVFPG